MIGQEQTDYAAKFIAEGLTNLQNLFEYFLQTVFETTELEKVSVGNHSVKINNFIKINSINKSADLIDQYDSYLIYFFIFMFSFVRYYFLRRRRIY